jgi:hypothetical protein
MSARPRRNVLQLPGPLPASKPGPAFPVDPALLAAMEGGSPGARARLARGEARLVVTGQQPSFPLPLGLTLLKVATAVALAARLSASSRLPVYPCFWSGGDDSDFEEAAGQRVPRPGRRPLDVALPGELAQKGAFVGDLDPGPAYAELLSLTGVDPGLARFGVQPGEDLGARELRLVLARFAPAGLLGLDARSPALRAAATPLYARYVERRQQFAVTLDAAGATLEWGGSEPPLRRGLGERALWLLRRGRRQLPEPDDYADALAGRLAEAPATLSPNAALRPLVQDAVLPVAAAVLGPGEWEYHRQLVRVFAVLDVHFPPAVPRLHARWDGDEDLHLDDPARRSSPLARSGHPLADSARLLALAREHLAAWASGELIEWSLPLEPEGA